MDFGKRNGDGPTVGKRAETIAATLYGVTYSKRVFKGQRALVLLSDGPEDPIRVYAASDEAAGITFPARTGHEVVDIVLPASLTP